MKGITPLGCKYIAFIKIKLTTYQCCNKKLLSFKYLNICSCLFAAIKTNAVGPISV